MLNNLSQNETNKDQLSIVLQSLKKKNDWLDYKVEEMEDGRICFKIMRHVSDFNGEIYFDNYKEFADLISHLGVD